MTPGALPILTYHAIDSSRSVTATDPSTFAETLDALLEAGFRAIDLGEWIKLGRPPVDRGFALAFDDGLRSVLGVADRLARLAIPATVFLVADRIGLDNAWPGQLSGIPRARLLGRADLESLARLGFRFGSHGCCHERFTRFTSEKLEQEMIGSRDRIEQELGRPCPLLAYPCGVSDNQVRLAASKVYDAAFGTRLAYATSSDDRYDIARIDAFYLRSRPALQRLIAGRWQGRLALRRALRAFRGTVSMMSHR